MSLYIFVLINKNSIPSVDTLSESIKREGFDVDFHDNFDTATSNGFVPCPNSDKGFEYSFGNLKEEDVEGFSFSKIQMDMVKKYDCIVGFRYKSESDFEIVKVVSAVFSKLAGGLVLEPEAGVVMEPKLAVEWAQGKFEPELVASKIHKNLRANISALSYVKIGILVLLMVSILLKMFGG